MTVSYWINNFHIILEDSVYINHKNTQHKCNPYYLLSISDLFSRSTHTVIPSVTFFTTYPVDNCISTQIDLAIGGSESFVSITFVNFDSILMVVEHFIDCTLLCFVLTFLWWLICICYCMSIVIFF